MGIKGEYLIKSELFWFIAWMGHRQQYIRIIIHKLLWGYRAALCIHVLTPSYITIPEWSKLLLLLDNRKHHINKKGLIKFFETHLEWSKMVSSRVRNSTKFWIENIWMAKLNWSIYMAHMPCFELFQYLITMVVQVDKNIHHAQCPFHKIKGPFIPVYSKLCRGVWMSTLRFYGLIKMKVDEIKVQ